LQFSEDGSSLVAAGDAGRIRVWEISSSSQQQAITAHTKEVTGLSLIGKNLVTASLDGTTKIWKPLAATQDHEIEGTVDESDSGL
jgi:WD40 repeat protein